MNGGIQGKRETYVWSREEDHGFRFSSKLDIIGNEIGRCASVAKVSRLDAILSRRGTVNAPENTRMPEFFKFDDGRVGFNNLGSHSWLSKRSRALRETNETIKLRHQFDSGQPNRVVFIEFAVDLRREGHVK